MQFEEFKIFLRGAGYPEVLERTWAPYAIAELHAHPFAAHALMVRGEMWLTVGDTTRHLVPGDTFHLEQGEIHSERYGVEGATYWVGRRG